MDRPTNLSPEKAKMHAHLMQLLDEVGKAYLESDIRLVCDKWHYALVNSIPTIGGPLLVGLNWGVDENYCHSAQTGIDMCDLTKEDLGSMVRVLPYLEKYYGNDFVSQLAQTNYNFFRSKYGSQLKAKDYELCEPIFDKLLELVKPSVLIATTSDLRKYLLSSGKLIDVELRSIEFKRGKSESSCIVAKARFKNGSKIRFLPHPNYRIPKAVREQAWEFCCGND